MYVLLILSCLFHRKQDEIFISLSRIFGKFLFINTGITSAIKRLEMFYQISKVNNFSTALYCSLKSLVRLIPLL